MRKVVIPLVIAAVVLGSCSREPDYFSKEYQTKNHIWKRFDVFWFDVPVQKNDVLDFYLTLSHDKTTRWISSG